MSTRNNDPSGTALAESIRQWFERLEDDSSDEVRRNLRDAFRNFRTPCGRLNNVLLHPHRCPALEAAMLDTIICGITPEDGRLTFLWVADNLSERYGIARGSFDGKSLADIYDEQTAQRHLQTARVVAETQKPHRQLELFRAPKGVFQHDLRVAPLVDPDGSVHEVIVFIRDITDYHQVEHQLSESETNYRRVLENVSEGLVIHRRGIVVYANPAVEKLFGAPLDSVIGENVLRFIHDEERAVAQARLQRLFETDEQLSPIRYKLLRSDGSILYADVNSSRIQFRGDDAILITIRDVTSSVHQQIRERRIEKQVQQSQKLESLAVLAGGIAHDFNNLLLGVLGNVSLAVLDLPRNSRVRDRLLQIENAAQHAAELTKQLLAYAGGGIFLPKPIDLSSVVRDMAELVAVSLTGNVTLVLNLDDQLDPVLADPVQVRQVTMNLLLNASEAMLDEGGEVSISTSSVRIDEAWLSKAYFRENRREGRYALLEVRDTGRGLSSDELSKIFDPFFSTKGAGRGLGLAAVLGIVRAHGGAVRVDSHPGQGTIFRLLFPFANERQRRQSMALSSDGVEAWEGHGQVLVIDDEEDDRLLASEVLERLGFRSVQASTSREALLHMGNDPEQYVAVLLDLTFPGMIGNELLDKIRSLRPDIPVVVSSGYSPQTVFEKVSRYPNVLYVQKPYTFEKLGPAMRHAVESKKERENDLAEN